MKKKYAIISLFVLGVILVVVSLAFSITETLSKDIIGGPGISTFMYVFFGWKYGICAALAFCGVSAIIIGTFLCVAKKKMTVCHFLYYFVSFVVCLCAVLFCTSVAGKLSQDKLSAALYAVKLISFACVPAISAVIVRFSMLRWYVDPFAAAEMPLCLYFLFFFSRGDFWRDPLGALSSVNASLFSDGCRGLLFLLGVYLFGLAVSFSIARKKGENISYRLASLTFGSDREN